MESEGRLDVVAVDTKDGAEAWRVALAQGPWPLVTGAFDAAGVVVVAVQTADSNEPAIVAVDAVDGHHRWEMPAGEFWPLANDDRVTVLVQRSGPDSRTPVGGLRWKMRAIDRTNGETRWERDSGIVNSNQPVDVVGSLLIYGEQRPDCAAACLTAVDLLTGDEVWTGVSVSDDDGAFNSTRIVAVGDVVVAQLEAFGPGADVVGLESATGDEMWRTRANFNYNGWVVDNDSFYDEQDRAARSAADGSIRWTGDAQGFLYAAGGGFVFGYGYSGVGTPAGAESNGEVFAISAEDGTTAWAVPVPKIEASFVLTATTSSDSVYYTLSDFAPTD
ncbi:MAG: PQQ-like beta-propeller repeat protein [Actinomycetota bacterium]|nr:PQQ-like beta-propeller repeat protein [Actinomycetota bacterium]